MTQANERGTPTYEGRPLPQGNLSTERKTGTALPTPLRPSGQR